MDLSDHLAKLPAHGMQAVGGDGRLLLHSVDGGDHSADLVVAGTV